MKLNWSDIAEADLSDIYDYIARDVAYYAELFVERIINATDKLQDNPRIGRRVPEADQRDEVRELIVQGYRIIYRVDSENIDILTVIHGARNLAGQDARRWNATDQ